MWEAQGLRSLTGSTPRTRMGDLYFGEPRQIPEQVLRAALVHQSNSGANSRACLPHDIEGCAVLKIQTEQDPPRSLKQLSSRT